MAVRGDKHFIQNILGVVYNCKMSYIDNLINDEDFCDLLTKKDLENLLKSANDCKKIISLCNTERNDYDADVYIRDLDNYIFKINAMIRQWDEMTHPNYIKK